MRAPTVLPDTVLVEGWDIGELVLGDRQVTSLQIMISVLENQG